MRVPPFVSARGKPACVCVLLRSARVEMFVCPYVYALLPVHVRSCVQVHLCVSVIEHAYSHARVHTHLLRLAMLAGNISVFTWICPISYYETKNYDSTKKVPEKLSKKEINTDKLDVFLYPVTHALELGMMPFCVVFLKDVIGSLTAQSLGEHAKPEAA